MTIARSTGALLGTSESVGVAVAAGATSTGTETDLLADNTSTGMINIYLCFTPASVPTSGILKVKYQDSRVQGQSYDLPARQWGMQLQGQAAAQQRVFLGRFNVSRYGRAVVTNGADVELTGVAVLYELEKTT